MRHGLILLAVVVGCDGMADDEIDAADVFDAETICDVGDDAGDVPDVADVAGEGDGHADAEADRAADDSHPEVDGTDEATEPECYSDDDCDDGVYCNGVEFCAADGCGWAPLDCNDDLPCTIDRCDESSAACVHSCMTGHDEDDDGCCRVDAACGTDCNDSVPGACTGPVC